MRETIIIGLQERINKAKSKGKCALDLYMKKKVLDTCENELDDILFIAFRNDYYIVNEHSEDQFRKLTLEQLADWIIETYCN